MTNEPLKRSTKPMDTLADLVATSAAIMAPHWGDGKDPNGAGGVDQSQLQVQILGGVCDHMGQGDLLAGYKFLYNPLFLIKLNQIGTLLLKTAGNSGLSPLSCHRAGQPILRKRAAVFSATPAGGSQAYGAKNKKSPRISSQNSWELHRS